MREPEWKDGYTIRWKWQELMTCADKNVEKPRMTTRFWLRRHGRLRTVVTDVKLMRNSVVQDLGAEKNQFGREHDVIYLERLNLPVTPSVVISYNVLL